jgi:hypothetical protein
MDVLVGVILFSLLFVAGAALLGGLIGKVLFGFVTVPMRNDNSVQRSGNASKTSDNEDRVIRLNQGPPDIAPESPEKFKGDVPVAGVFDREEAVNDFVSGENRTVELEREPTNEHDPNAVKVIGSWTDRRGEIREEQLGYLPAEVAQELAEKEPSDTPIEATVTKLFEPRPRKSAGLRLDLWVPRDHEQ